MALRIRPGNPRFSKPVQMAFAVSLLVAGVIYLSLPKVEVRLVKRPWDTRGNHDYPLLHVHGQSLQEARRILSNPTNTESMDEWERWGKNHYLGTLMREEDSPGNYILREKDGEIEYVVYDAEGADSVRATWRPEQK